MKLKTLIINILIIIYYLTLNVMTDSIYNDIPN